MGQERNTEELIIEAAKKVFIRRGLAGARMQEIADEAGINKALLHYYYRSKEKLFEIVFNEALEKVLSRIGSIVSTKMPLEKKIAAIVENYINGLVEMPYLPMFVLNEINQQPEILARRMRSRSSFPDLQQFMKEIADAGRKGAIRKVNPIQLLLNVLSMCIFPFIVKPLVQAVLDIENTQYGMIIEERKKVVTETVLAWLRP